LAGGEGLLLLAALARVPMPRNAATTAAAEMLLKALKKTGIVIESSFPFQSDGSAQLLVKREHEAWLMSEVRARQRLRPIQRRSLFRL
jgi:hypothetical protein